LKFLLLPNVILFRLQDCFVWSWQHLTDTKRTLYPSHKRGAKGSLMIRSSIALLSFDLAFNL
jgi:hypothetical protein